MKILKELEELEPSLEQSVFLGELNCEPNELEAILFKTSCDLLTISKNDWEVIHDCPDAVEEEVEFIFFTIRAGGFSKILDGLYFEKRNQTTELISSYFKRLSIAQESAKVHINEHRFFFFLHKYLQLHLIELTNRFDFLKLKYSQRQKSTKSISRESTALFCSIVNHLEIDCRDHEVDSKAADYCKRVCTNFNLTYKDKVRQLYSDKPTIKKSDIHRVNLQKMILPLVDKEIAKQINLFIESELKKSR